MFIKTKQLIGLKGGVLTDTDLEKALYGGIELKEIFLNTDSVAMVSHDFYEDSEGNVKRLAAVTMMWGETFLSLDENLHGAIVMSKAKSWAIAEGVESETSV